jgi:hypothetical protein
MDAKEYGEQPGTRNGICRLEWIAWAIEAARRHKENEHQRTVPHDDRGDASGADEE